ncbi:MAG: CsgG/HfaB family protein [Candidatus Eisenbacteria bacterium]
MKQRISLIFPARASLFLLAVLIAGACLGRPLPAGAQAAAEPLLAEFRKDPFDFYFGLRTGEALQCGQAVLQGEGGFTPEERQKALAVLAAIYLNQGHAPEARAAVSQILVESPICELPNRDLMPKGLIQLFYCMRDSLMLAQDLKMQPDIRTLAIGDIENNSIVAGKFDLDRFVKGLTHVMITDLQGATPFRIVDRQRLAALRDEIQMSQNADIMNPQYAVPFGQLTGAQSYLFGSLMQVDDNKIRLDLRWVNTATTEVLLAEGIEMKLSSSDDLFKLEEKLLLEILVPRMEEYLTGQGAGDAIPEGGLRKQAEPYLKNRKQEVPRQGGDYVGLLIRAGDAMLAEEQGDFAAARTAWEDVAEMHPQDPVAGDRAKAMNAMLAMAGTGR